MLFHRLIYPFLYFLFYFSYAVDSPFHFYGHPKPIFREYFLWAFAPLAVFLLMLSALVYLAVPHPLQHFQDFHDLFHIHKHFTHRKFLLSFYYTILYWLNYTILFCMGQVLSIHLPILFCMVFLVSTIWICYTQPIKKKTGDINIWQ